MSPQDVKEFSVLKKYNTTEKIQSFLDTIPFNHEKRGETCMSPRRVLREHRAHCFEAALLACVCFMLSGKKPLIVSLKVRKPDDDHIIIIFKQNGYYGALSKTNHPVLRYRDPVYRTIRELVMSYFHEYFLFTNGTKSLLGYTKPINLKRFGTKWMTAEEDLWDMGKKIYYMPINKIVPSKNKRYLRKASAFERKSLDVQEWK